jgi:hypothetical protein
LSLIGAAVVYAPMGPWPISYSVPGTPLEGYALAFVLASAGFFVFGLALMLYQKSNKLGFFSAALGSLLLFGAAFADGYKARITEVVFDDVKVARFVNPYREYALPIVLVSVVFLALSFHQCLAQSQDDRIFLGALDLINFHWVCFCLWLQYSNQ